MRRKKGALPSCFLPLWFFSTFDYVLILNNMRFKPIYLVLVLVLCACSRNKLTGDFAKFKGSYTWKITYSKKPDGNIFTVDKSDSLYPQKTGYTAALELNGDGEIIFYKNGEVVSKNKYVITDKEDPNKLPIKLKGSSGALKIDDNRLNLILRTNGELTVEHYPFDGMDKASNYRADFVANSNTFVRQ